MNQPAQRRPLFGELAIRAGWLGQEHVNWALSVQAERKKHGVHLYLGTILVNQQYISVQQAVQILQHQRVQIMADPSSNLTYNVHNYDQRQSYKSPESTALLTVAQNVQSLNVRGDIGLRQVQQGAMPPPGTGGPNAGIWEDWTGNAQAAQAQPQQGGSPVFAELSSEEKDSGNADDYDWYGQTILDDGSLAEQLKRAAAESAEGSAIAEPMEAEAMPAEVDEGFAPIASVSTSGTRAKPGTVAYIAMPAEPEYDAMYRAVSNLLASKGIASCRLDDVADPNGVWKGIERFISGAALTIADLSGQPPVDHVVREATHAFRHRKPTIIMTSTPDATKPVAQQHGFRSVAIYNPGDTFDAQQKLEPVLDRILNAAQLVG